MSSMFETARHAARRLRRAPAISLTASLTLMLGIGATTAVFSVVRGVLLRPLPYPAPEQLVDLSHTLDVSGVTHVDQSDATYLYYARANRVFTGVAAYRVVGVNVGGLVGGPGGGDDRAERESAGRVSASTFAVLGGVPLAGRAFAERDDVPGAPPVVVVGQRLWQRTFGSDPAIIGRPLDVDGVAREIIGIMPASFRLPGERTDLWLPLGLDPSNTASAAFDYRGVARLRPGVSIAVAAADLQRLLPVVPEAFPGRLTASAIEQTHMRAVVRPLRDVVVGDIGRTLWVVLGAVACVLLIACANVMNLFLVRAEARHHEMAIRRALGAGRRRLIAEFLSEGLILAAAGGVLGVALAAASVRVLRSLEGTLDLPRVGDIAIDGSVLAMALGVTSLAAVLVSLIPAIRSARLDASAALGDAGRSATAGRRRHRARHALVVTQVALALVLVAAAGLMARSFARLRSVPPGFDATHAFAFRVALPQSTYASTDDALRFIMRVVDELGALPGVRDVGAVTKLPLVADARRDTAFFIEDRPLAPGGFPAVHQIAFASPGYFRALGIPLLEGRLFERPDPAVAEREVIVSRAFAERYWPGERALGRRVRMGPRAEWHTVVGVAGDVRGTALEQPPDDIVYLPLVTALGSGTAGAAQRVTETRWAPRELAFVMRVQGDPALAAAGAARVLRETDPAVPAYAARAMTGVLGQAVARTSVTLVLLGVASAVALLLGAVGLYGVVSYIVSLRSREMAIRLALGAQAGDVRRMVSRQAIAVAAVGVGAGLIAAVATTRVLGALLFDVSPTDVATLASATALLLAVAAVASWWPARRAAALDPAEVLRAE